jgi:phosphatidylinositol 4-phosphatase
MGDGNFFFFFSDYSLFYYFVLWFTLMLLSVLFILAHGMDYVSWPKLVPMDDVLYYDGPGKRYGNAGKGIKIEALSSRRVGKSQIHEIEMGTKKRID